MITVFPSFFSLGFSTDGSSRMTEPSTYQHRYENGQYSK